MAAGAGVRGAGGAAAAAGGREIALQNPNHYPDVAPRALRPWLGGLVAVVAPGAASVAVRFCGDRGMRRINRDFRGKDGTTDVLSFPGDLEGDADRAAGAAGEDGGVTGGRGDGAAGSGGVGAHLGDILISVPQARRQAAAAGHAVEHEIRVLVLHGVLHCLGYDHEVDDGRMERLERRLRRRFVGARRSAYAG